jgi:hypothetical protein
MNTKPLTREMRDAAQTAKALRLVKRFMRFCVAVSQGNQPMPPRHRERNPEASKSRAFESALAGIAMDHDEAVSVLKREAMERRDVKTR